MPFTSTVMPDCSSMSNSVLRCLHTYQEWADISWFFRSSTRRQVRIECKIWKLKLQSWNTKLEIWSFDLETGKQNFKLQSWHSRLENSSFDLETQKPLYTPSWCLCWNCLSAANLTWDIYLFAAHHTRRSLLLWNLHTASIPLLPLLHMRVGRTRELSGHPFLLQKFLYPTPESRDS